MLDLQFSISAPQLSTIAARCAEIATDEIDRVLSQRGLPSISPDELVMVRDAVMTQMGQLLVQAAVAESQRLVPPVRDQASS